MSKHKKNPRVGQGMKPRTPQTQWSEPKEGVVGIDTASVPEGQGDGQNEAVMSEVQPVETGKELAEDSVQILDSAETADVAADTHSPATIVLTGFKELPDVHEEVQDFTEQPERSSLEELMGNGMTPIRLIDGDTGAIGVFTPGADHDDKIYAAGLAKVSIADIEQAMSEHRSVEILPNGAVVVGPKVGQREDGTFGLVVTIPEGMIEPIRQQAEADRVTSEEWVSTRLNEYLDSWWSAPKGR